MYSVSLEKQTQTFFMEGSLGKINWNKSFKEIAI